MILKLTLIQKNIIVFYISLIPMKNKVIEFPYYNNTFKRKNTIWIKYILRVN